jgi:hypothetical protein
MNLKEYIKTAITDITSAISELQDELINGAIVSPSLESSPKDCTTIRNPNDPNCIMKLTEVSFDVATTIGTNEGKSLGGGFGIQIFSTNIESESATKLENVSRISFTIPLALPAYRLKTDEERHGKGKPIRSTGF